MEISIISTTQGNGQYHTKYKYWVKGECGCTAITIIRSFNKLPNRDDLINAINF